MAKRFLVFQHTPWEGPGDMLVRAAKKNGIDLHLFRVWQDHIPSLNHYDALLVLGGSPNVNQEKQYPFLREEKAAIRRSIDEDRPFLGFCLGHQLLADTLGARVCKNHMPSVGFIKGYLTHAGREHPLFAGFPKRILLFKWHGQAVMEPLPDHLELLMTSVDCQVEALSVVGRPHIVGLQSDNHAASPHNVKEWLQHDSKWLASLASDIDPSHVLQNAEEAHSLLAEQFMLLFSNFCNFT